MKYLMPPITLWLDIFDGKTEKVEEAMDVKLRVAKLETYNTKWVTGSKAPKE